MTKAERERLRRIVDDMIDTSRSEAATVNAESALDRLAADATAWEAACDKAERECVERGKDIATLETALQHAKDDAARNLRQAHAIEAERDALRAQFDALLLRLQQATEGTGGGDGE